MRSKSTMMKEILLSFVELLSHQSTKAALLKHAPSASHPSTLNSKALYVKSVKLLKWVWRLQDCNSSKRAQKKEGLACDH